MSHVELVPDLDQRVADQIMRPYVDHVLDLLLREAKTNAPPVKVWISQRDERVRVSHTEADGQMVPDNLRFHVPHPDGASTEMARAPRDRNLSDANYYGCRCAAVSLDHPLRESLRSTGATVTGTRVTGSVETRFPRAGESEVGTGEDEAARFMARAADAVVQRLRGG